MMTLKYLMLRVTEQSDVNTAETLTQKEYQLLHKRLMELYELKEKLRRDKNGT